MVIDYKALGRRIRAIRKGRRMSQEKLAESIDVSTPHMSNIENGKTKFSLQVLVDLADALKTTPDGLLLNQMDDQIRTRGIIIEEISRELADCTSVEMFMLEDMMKDNKKILKQYEQRLLTMIVKEEKEEEAKKEAGKAGEKDIKTEETKEAEEGAGEAVQAKEAAETKEAEETKKIEDGMKETESETEEAEKRTKGIKEAVEAEGSVQKKAGRKRSGKSNRADREKKQP